MDSNPCHFILSSKLHSSFYLCLALTILLPRYSLQIKTFLTIFSLHTAKDFRDVTSLLFFMFKFNTTFMLACFSSSFSVCRPVLLVSGGLGPVPVCELGVVGVCLGVRCSRSAESKLERKKNGLHS